MADARRKFLAQSTVLAAFPVLTVTSALANKSRAQENAVVREEDKRTPIFPAELLMREHGALTRLLIVYEEGVRRLRAKEEARPEIFQSTAKLVRKFFEDHHVKIEEEMLFHQLIRRKLLNDTITVLTKQHEVGRKLTDAILQFSISDQFSKTGNQEKLIAAIEAYVRMYRAHTAREDTVFYPMLAKVYTTTELKGFAEQITAKENKIFGEDGFDKLVEEVVAIEQRLKVNDLDSFTARDVK